MKLVKYWDKYTEMHGQQNVKILLCNFYWRRSAGSFSLLDSDITLNTLFTYSFNALPFMLNTSFTRIKIRKKT